MGRKEKMDLSFCRILKDNGVLGLVAISYVSIDYLRYLSPFWHGRLQPALWIALAIAAISRVPFYRYWAEEFRAAIPFLASILFMLSALLYEAFSVRFVTAVLGLDWHISASPLPDTGQWLLLALNEKFPHMVVDMLRAHIAGLHHFLMLFIMLGFSVLFNSIRAPGLGLAARYMFTMAVGRLLRAVTFVSTILPSVRPWCASSRFAVAAHPHPWAQKYYEPYASDADAIYRLIRTDNNFATAKEYPLEYRPDWGKMSFLINILRPNFSEGSTWYHLLKKAGGGCNDLWEKEEEASPVWPENSSRSLFNLPSLWVRFSPSGLIGKIFGASKTAVTKRTLVKIYIFMKNAVKMFLRSQVDLSVSQIELSDPGPEIEIVFQEAYGGWTSAFIWFLVLHSAQREIRERHHYSVDVIVAIYVGILLWRMTGFIWSYKDTSKAKRLAKLDQLQGRLTQAVKDSDIDELRELLEEVDLAGKEQLSFPQWMVFMFAGIATAFSLTCVLLAFTLTSDG